MANKALLIQENESESKDLNDVLTSIGYETVRIVHSSEDISTVSSEYSPDIIIVDVYRPSVLLLNKLSDAIQNNPAPVVMFVDESSDEIISDAVMSGVSAYVVDGYQRNRVRSIISLAVARFAERERLLNELSDARQALDERKVLDRAKGIVMKQKQCDEGAAYSLIRKMAMDKNMRIVDIAKQLVDVAELL